MLLLVLLRLPVDALPALVLLLFLRPLAPSSSEHSASLVGGLALFLLLAPVVGAVLPSADRVLGLL